MSLAEPAGGPTLVVARGEGVNGELVLRTDGEDFEVIANGVFLMDTRQTTSERSMVAAALSRVAPRARILVGGLGVGSSIVEALACGAARIDVVEIEPLVIAWWDTYFRAHWGLSTSDVAAVRVINEPIQAVIARAGEVYDAIVLDTDNGPEWLVADTNAEIYETDALHAVTRLVADGGTCTYWSASPSDAFESRLRGVWRQVDRVDVERGDVPPDVLYVCADPRDRDTSPEAGGQ